MKDHLDFKEAQKKGKEQSASKRVADTNPSHALAAYTGDFEHPGYGVLSVTLNEGELQATFNAMTFPIRHYHYDIFELVLERWEEVMKISFLTNVKGDIDTLIAPFEPTGSDIVFKRVPSRQMRERSFLEQFVGVYEFMETQIVVVLKGDHTLSVSMLGQPDYELEPYQGSEFLARGVSGVSLEFQHDASGAVTGVAATLPYGVFSASRKG